MNNIVLEVIAAHLVSNRRLVIPGFGAFMVKETGEKLFSDLLRTDDGVLYSLLREKGLSEMEAAVTVDRFAFEVRHELDEFGYCRLGEVGTLRVEPETKALRLYPPVAGVGVTEPISTPYVPEPIVAEESEETAEEMNEVAEEINEVAEVEEVEVETSEVEEAEPEKVEKPKDKPQPKQKPRKKKTDWVIVFAIVALVLALLGVAYGWYVSTLNYTNAAADEKAMDELRIAPNPTIENE